MSDDQVDKVKEYLDSLKWDGSFNIDGLAADPAFDHPARTAEALNEFFADAVKRAYEPGCRITRTMMIVGPEGCGKTQLLRDVGGELYSARRAEPKKLILELCAAEWVGSQHLKDYLAALEDSFRLPYAKDVVHEPRAFLPVVTYNDERPFEDSRRFYVVRMSRCCVAVDASLRDQLWAEAVTWYKRERSIDSLRATA